jgi:hypothetical protein
MVLLIMWSVSPRSCGDFPDGGPDAWKPLGASDFGSDDGSRQAELSGGSYRRRVTFGEGDELTIEWTGSFQLRSAFEPTSLSSRRWDGKRWHNLPPIAFPSAPGSVSGGSWFSMDEEQVYLLADDTVQTLPKPERPTRIVSSCMDVWKTPYHGPATVTLDPDGQVWFLEPTAGALNAWRWSRDQARWKRMGRFHKETGSGEDRGPTTPSVAFDAAGRPVVAWYEDGEREGVLRTWRWTGRVWKDLGDIAIEADRPGHVLPTIATDGNRILLATTGTASARLFLHTRSGWAPLVNPPASAEFAFAFTRGQPVVAWADPGKVSMAVLDTGWREVGTWSIDSFYSPDPQLVSAPDGRLILSFMDLDLQVLVWDGKQVSRVHPPSPHPPGLSSEVGADPILAVDERGHPTVAWYAGRGGLEVRTRTWTGETWTEPPGVRRGRQQAHLVLGERGFELALVDPEPYSTENTVQCMGSSVWRSDGPLAFGWDREAQSLVVCQQTQEGWVRLPSFGKIEYRMPKLSARGNLVAWVEPGEISDRVLVREWTGTTWDAVGGAVVAECGGHCTGVALAEGGGKLCVAWTERAGVAVRCVER